MKPLFSEFSYGFALSQEIMNISSNIKGVPLFPSLREEAKLGYDVKISFNGMLLFLQFKLPDYLTRSNARYWDDYYKPFYRINLYKRVNSRQHEMLKRLARTGGNVYYVAPSFCSEEDFSKFFRSKKLIQKSIFVPLSSVPDINDDEQHHITYHPSFSGFNWHSTGSPSFGDVDISGERFLESTLRKAQGSSMSLLNFYKLLQNVVTIVKEQTSGFEEVISEYTSWDRIQELLQERPLADLHTPSLGDDNEGEYNELFPVVIQDLRYLLTAFLGVETMLLVRQT